MVNIEDRKLEILQPWRTALRLVMRTRKKEHITPVLFQLHWLPIRFRSLYKILFYPFKVLSWTAPLYLIQKYIPVRMPRFESYSLLTVPKSRRAMYGEKSFQASAHRLWNKLPNDIKLCKVLKIHLFKLAYSSNINQFIMNKMCLCYMNSEYVLILL